MDVASYEAGKVCM